LLVARMIREDFLHQNAFHEVDTYTSIKKQYIMLKNIIHFYEESLLAIEKGVSVSELSGLPVLERIARMKFVPEDRMDEIESIRDEITKEISSLQGVNV